jgi:hypothetical protein
MDPPQITQSHVPTEHKRIPFNTVLSASTAMKKKT